MTDYKRTNIASRLTDLFGFKNRSEAAKALGIPAGTFNHLASGRAGKSMRIAYRLVIAFAESLSEKKRKKILSNLKEQNE